MREHRPFPVGPAEPQQQYVQVPVDRNGRPVETSKAWKTLVANAMARAPENRSPAERALVRRLCAGS